MELLSAVNCAGSFPGKLKMTTEMKETSGFGFHCYYSDASVMDGFTTENRRKKNGWPCCLVKPVSFLVENLL